MDLANQIRRLDIGDGIVTTWRTPSHEEQLQTDQATLFATFRYHMLRARSSLKHGRLPSARLWLKQAALSLYLLKGYRFRHGCEAWLKQVVRLATLATA